MSTHGRTRRTWLSVEVFSERIYEDGRGSPPDHVLRLGPVMLAVVPRAGRWRRRLFDLEAWSLIAGREWRDGVTLYTPFAEFDVHFNDDTHPRWIESGDIPEEARRDRPCGVPGPLDRCGSPRRSGRQGRRAKEDEPRVAREALGGGEQG